DEAPKQLMREAIAMGWEDAEDYLQNGSFVFVDAGGKQFTDFIKNELANFVRDWEGHGARIVIDPLTPVLWSLDNKYEQREIVSFLLRETRKIGTVLSTLEEHGGKTDLSTPEIAIPMYLADNVIHLRYTILDNPESRELKIIKTRMSPHSKYAHPYSINQGVGVAVHEVNDLKMEKEGRVDVQRMFNKMVKDLPKEKFASLKPGEKTNITRTVKAMTKNAHYENAEEVLRLIFQEYGLYAP
ncbi:MAG: ATPase domain-containing protein, partial [Candidatus Thermoplasmatota archaeon]|nr:ATPase domain-containing protein [Candidatus Thermoplasmatota archaeon]